MRVEWRRTGDVEVVHGPLVCGLGGLRGHEALLHVGGLRHVGVLLGVHVAALSRLGRLSLDHLWRHIRMSIIDHYAHFPLIHAYLSLSFHPRPTDNA